MRTLRLDGRTGHAVKPANKDVLPLAFALFHPNFFPLYTATTTAATTAQQQGHTVFFGGVYFGKQQWGRRDGGVLGETTGVWA